MVRIHPVFSLHLSKNQHFRHTPDSYQAEKNCSVMSSFGFPSCHQSSFCCCLNCASVPFVAINEIKPTIDHSNFRASSATSTMESANDVCSYCLDENLLRVPRVPSILIYSQSIGDQIQIGVCVALSIDDCFNCIIKGHESTIKRNDEIPNNQLSSVDPVMLFYRDRPLINKLVDRIVTSQKPTFSKTSSSCVNIWEVIGKDRIQLEEAFKAVDCLYVADGHHRIAAACRRALEAQQPKQQLEHPSIIPQSSTQRFITGILFPQSQLRVQCFGRCLQYSATTDPFNEAALLAKIQRSFFLSAYDESCLPVVDVKQAPSVLTYSHVFASGDDSCSESDCDRSFGSGETDSSSRSVSETGGPGNRQRILMYLNGRWHELSPKVGDPISHPLESFGVQILQDRLLHPVFGITEGSEGAGRYEIQYVCPDPQDSRYSRGKLAESVDRGDSCVAFYVDGLRVDDIMTIADAGLLLPPKATCFLPKPLPGLLSHLLH